MRQYSISAIVFRCRLSGANRGRPVLTASRNRVGSALFRVGVLAIGIFLPLLAASPARAIPFGPYQLTIFQTTDGDTFDMGVPAINDRGKIAIVVSLDAGGQQVRTYNEVNNPTIILADSAFFGNGDIAINNNDTVVFSGSIASDAGLFASSGGLISTVVDDSQTFSVDGSAITTVLGPNWDLADNGDVVVFRAVLFGPGPPIGIYQRNLADAEIFRRIETALDFNFGNPAVNAQAKLAVRLDFLDCGPPSCEITRQQILSDFGPDPIMDTNDKFDVDSPHFPESKAIDMNNGGTVAFRAKLDSGFEGIFTFAPGSLFPLRPDVLTTVVDTSGPFEELHFPSINIGGTVAFLATFDVGGGEGIYRGPNPITDKIIAIGDVIGKRQGTVRTVVNITGFGNDGLSRNGQVAFTVLDQLGTEYLMYGRRGLTFDFEAALLNVQLTTAMDSKRAMMQQFSLPHSTRLN